MKTLVISRPVYDYILPLVEFPQDGDKFFINNSVKTISNIGSLVAITLAKYGMDVSFTGAIGEDDIGRKVKEVFDNYRIDTKYIETSYTEKTCVNYKIYNSKSNKFTNITENCLKNGLTKFKYEFIPDVVVMDNGDYNANLAAINNYPNAKLIYIGEKFSKDTLVYCNKCNYIISTLSFASEATGITNNLNKPKTMVSLFQKFIDLYNANLIIKLDNFDILYCVNDEVRIIKNINKNISNKDNVYYSVLTYFLININDIETSIKYTNKVMLSSASELDMIKNIPDYNEIRTLLENNQVSSSQVDTIDSTNNENVSIQQNQLNEHEQAVKNDNDLEQPKLVNEDVETINIPEERINDVETL